MIDFGTALVFLGMFAVVFILVYIPVYLIIWIVFKTKGIPITKEVKKKVNIGVLIWTVVGLAIYVYLGMHTGH